MLQHHNSIIVEDSSSEGSEENDQFQENVDNGYFSLDENIALENEKTDADAPSTKFEEQFIQMIKDRAIKDMRLSNDEKKRHKIGSIKTQFASNLA